MFEQTMKSKVTVFVLVFSLVLLHGLISLKLGTQQKWNNTHVSMLMALISSITILMITHKNNENTENFTFEVSKPLLCRGYPHLTASNKELHQYCKDMGQEEREKYVCGNGYKGVPINFEYTPLSNGNWTNERTIDNIE